ncbi:MAG: carboxypeptidase-like regulatory domain-containing protein [Bacteroidota bacterium]
MKNAFFLVALLFGTVLFAQETIRTITGRISDGSNAIENVAVVVEGKSTQTFSDSKGRYAIKADKGDNISYTYQGLKTVIIKVEDVTKVLNITMVPDVEELEEVTILGSNRKTPRQLELEYPTNQNIIRTAYGFLNAETAPGNIRFLAIEEINPIAVCILDLLRSEFSGVDVRGTCLGAFGFAEDSGEQVTNIRGNNIDETGAVGPIADANGGQSSLIGGRVFVRGGGSILNPRSAIFDVDGQIFTDVPIWIDVTSIKRLAILNDFATTTQYGAAAAGGVIVVNTVNGIPQNAPIFDRARLRNNFASKNILSLEQLRKNGPTYLSELQQSNSFEEARVVYNKYKSAYGGSPYFFLDAQDYFKTKWNEKEFSEEIIGSNFYMFDKNPVLLKALAYLYQEQGEYEQANGFYKRVMELRSNYAQSYMDLANSYRELGNVQQAAAIYNRYTYLVGEGLMQADSTGFDPILEREYNNLLTLNKGKLVRGQKAAELYVAEEDFTGTRLVFEWNDSEAEFELQFVNPERQYHMVKHSLADNAEMIRKEKEFGYNTTEYLIDGSLPGTWTVNVNYLGNKSLTPTYLKATVYYNYGTFSQRKETQVFKLSLKEVPHELFRLTTSGRVASR